MNSLVERVRQMLDDVGHDRGRRLALAVRVPSNYGRTPPTPETARQFFDFRLRKAWVSVKSVPYDFLVQSERWKLGPISIAILRKQFDKTYVAVSFDNNGRPVSLNFILVSGPDGWVISDVESPHDSLRMFLAQYRR
jgi:hypothetical protein